MLRTQFLGYSFQVQAAGNVNPFLTNAPFMEKPGSWFLLAKCDLHLYLKCHSSIGVFHTFRYQEPSNWFVHVWNIGKKRNDYAF